jgi:hypothetical protein
MEIFIQAAPRFSLSRYILGRAKAEIRTRGLENGSLSLSLSLSRSKSKEMRAESTWRQYENQRPTMPPAAHIYTHKSALHSARDDDNNFDWCTAVILASISLASTCHFYFARTPKVMLLSLRRGIAASVWPLAIGWI